MSHHTLPANPPAAPAPRRTATLDVAAAVERTLTEFLASATRDLIRLDPAVEPLTTTARDAAVGGGKRIRPTFAYWGWRGVVGDCPAPEPVIPALAALELLHAFALVHDDVMDRSATRRGRPTAHRALAARHAATGLRGDPQRHGDSAAVLVGDLCLVWADQLMARSGVPREALAGARDSYELMRVEAIAGQFLDLLGEASPAWSVEQALRTVRLKTASYTVIRPLHYGAALGGAGEDTLLGRAYTRYGRAVGEAFQFRDDLLGVYGEPAVTGKPVGEDLALGKPTVLLQLARSMATGAASAELERLLLQPRPESPPHLLDLVNDTGAVARLDRMISDRVSDAIDTLDAAPIDDSTRLALTELALAAAWRTA